MALTFIAVRHAQPESEGFADETLRTLDEQGRFIHAKITQMMKNDGIFPDRIYCSPIVRAIQTAAIMGEVFGVEVVEIQELGYDFNQTILLNILKNGNPNSTIMMVGHEPTLAQFVNKLVGERVLPRGLPKSGAAHLTFGHEVDYQKAIFHRLYQFSQ